MHLELDEVHKLYGGRGALPTLVAAWREYLRARRIVLIETGITATPKYAGEKAPKANKERERLAQRCCTLLGVPVAQKASAIATLAECTVEADAEATAAIFRETRQLQTRAPEGFESHTVAVLGTRPSAELKGRLGDTKTLLLGLAVDGVDGHIDRFVAFKTCMSLAVAQAVVDADAGGLLESVLGRKEGVKVHTVERKDDVAMVGGEDSDDDAEEAEGNDALQLSTAAATCRANTLLVADTPAAAKLIVDALKERNDAEGARTVRIFDLATTDRGAFHKNMAGFMKATRASGGELHHPIGVIDPSQLESCNDFGKGCFNLVAVGALASQLLVQGPGRLGRAVPMEEGDVVPVDGYTAHHLSSKWQTTLATVFSRKPGAKESLAKPCQELLEKYEEKRKPEYAREMREDWGLEDEDEWPEDPLVERAACTAKQLHKVDKAKLLLAPHTLAKTYLEALLDEGKKKTLLDAAFGEEGVLAKYKFAHRSVSAAVGAPQGIDFGDAAAEDDDDEDDDATVPDSDDDAEDAADADDAGEEDEK